MSVHFHESTMLWIYLSNLMCNSDENKSISALSLSWSPSCSNVLSHHWSSFWKSRAIFTQFLQPWRRKGVSPKLLFSSLCNVLENNMSGYLTLNLCFHLLWTLHIQTPWVYPLESHTSLDMPYINPFTGKAVPHDPERMILITFPPLYDGQPPFE